MVPRQPSTHRGTARARIALGVAHSPAHRYRCLYYSSYVVDLPDPGVVDFIAGPLHPPGILSERFFVISNLAATGSGTGGMGLCRHDGITYRAKTVGVFGADQ